MLKLNCIINIPSLLPQITKLVERKAHQLHSKEKSARVADVYRELRDDGYEIDAESVAFAYKGIPSIVDKVGFSSVADLNRFGGEGIKTAIEIANKGDLKKQRVGKLGIATTIAKGMATTFSTLKNTNDVDKSHLYQLQEAMRRVAASMLDKKGFSKNIPESFTERLNHLFAIEDTQAALKESMKGRVQGQANTVEEIWKQMQGDIDAIAKGIKDKADRQQFIEMTNSIRNSNYELLLGTQEADNIVKDVLKKAGYAKTVTRGGNPTVVVDWNKAAANQNDWKQEFSEVFKNEGFSDVQVGRIIDRLERNYNAALTRYAEGKLSAVQKKNNITPKVNKDALARLISLKNAGIFNPQNRPILNQVLGADIPPEITDQVRDILDDYEANTKDTGALSNVETEEVVRAIRNLVAPLNKNKIEKVVQAFGDYQALKSGSIISTALNTFQNVTSGVNSSVISTISALAATKNPKLILRFAKGFLDTLLDVSAGGVTIRDADTKNANEIMQGRGGLSDRWVWDRVEGFMGGVRALLNTLPQITGTAFDAANGSIIYNARMINEIKPILRAKGLSSSEANKAIDDILFGQHSSGISNRQFWVNESKKRLSNQAGIKDRNIKATRVADELIWHKLVTDYGLSVDQIKAMQSAAIEQKSRDLGHQSDVYISPAWALEAFRGFLGRKMDRAKAKGNNAEYVILNAVNVANNAINMFVGGKANWAILTLENSPFGVLMGGLSIASSEIFAKGEVPLYRQQLDLNDPAKLKEQLAKRNSIKGRFERGVYGTIIQGLLYAGVMSLMNKGDDDDDRKEEIKKTFQDAYGDPKTRRMFDKMLPMSLAAELQFAYDRKAGRLDMDKVSQTNFLPKYIYGGDLWDYATTQVATRTGLDRLQDSFDYNSKIKDKNKKAENNAEALWKFVGETTGVPYAAWYKIETDEMKLIENDFEPQKGAAKEQKEKYKKELKSLDGRMDAFFYGMGLGSTYQFFKNEK